MIGLTDLGVDIKLATRVVSTSITSTGKTEIIYSDGSKARTDFYIPTFGVVPNSSFIPSELLNEKGFAIVDEYLKVKGANDIWAVGDINDLEWAQWIYMDFQSQYLSKQIVALLKGKAAIPYKISTASTRMFSLISPLPSRSYKQRKLISFVLI